MGCRQQRCLAAKQVHCNQAAHAREAGRRTFHRLQPSRPKLLQLYAIACTALPHIHSKTLILPPPGMPLLAFRCQPCLGKITWLLTLPAAP